MQRALQASDIAGIRAFAVYAKDEQARSFCQKFDFIPSPIDPMPVRAAQGRAVDYFRTKRGRQKGDGRNFGAEIRIPARLLLTT